MVIISNDDHLSKAESLDYFCFSLAVDDLVEALTVLGRGKVTRHYQSSGVVSLEHVDGGRLLPDQLALNYVSNEKHESAVKHERPFRSAGLDCYVLGGLRE